MVTGRKTLPLAREDDALLRLLYLQWKIPTDQFARRPEDMDAFTKNWNNLAGRSDSSIELLHYIVTKRKNGQWVRLGEDHQEMPDRQHAALSGEDCMILDEIYEDLQIPSDRLVVDNEASTRFAQEFARRTGKIIPPIILSATMVTRRKNGELTTLKPKNDDGKDLGFKDIDQVSG